MSLLAPRSRGQVRPYRKDGTLYFAIEHNQVSDAESTDLRAMVWGVHEARRMAACEPFASMVEEIQPGPPKGDDAAIADWIRQHHQHYFHPAATCSIGADPAKGAVVDAHGRVHGLDGLMVADASIMPYVTSANTNIPTAAIGHRLARKFDEIVGAPRG